MKSFSLPLLLKFSVLFFLSQAAAIGSDFVEIQTYRLQDSSDSCTYRFVFIAKQCDFLENVTKRYDHKINPLKDEKMRDCMKNKCPRANPRDVSGRLERFSSDCPSYRAALGFPPAIYQETHDYTVSCKPNAAPNAVAPMPSQQRESASVKTGKN